MNKIKIDGAFPGCRLSQPLFLSVCSYSEQLLTEEPRKQFKRSCSSIDLKKYYEVVVLLNEHSDSERTITNQP